jgi:hypothetical protein
MHRRALMEIEAVFVDGEEMAKPRTEARDHPPVGIGEAAAWGTP